MNQVEIDWTIPYGTSRGHRGQMTPLLEPYQGSQKNDVLV